MSRRIGGAVLVASAAALTGCSDKAVPANDIDVANAASSAQRNIDNYAAGARDAPSGVIRPDRPERRDEEAASPPSPAASASASSATPSPPASLAETPFAADSAQGAADVVQTYYALLESGRYRQAWRLWDDDGRATGMSVGAFAASFAKYRDYHADVGAPGRVDAGAGQRHVTVPVRVYGKLKAGDAAFAMAGPVTLHRVADIDGATAAQRVWRISDSGVRPRPGGARSPTSATNPVQDPS